MKKIIIPFIFIIGLAHSVCGQSYQSVFADSCATWYIFSVTENNLAGGTDVRQVIAGDTVYMDGRTYYYLRHNNDESMYELGVYNNEPQLLRENESHSKLFFKENYPGISVPEILIMDMDLEAGDTLDTHGWSGLFFDGLLDLIPRITIDSCFNLSGRKILRTDFSFVSFGGRKDTLFFIEGVGPSFGPYYPRQRHLNSLSCYYKDNICLYHGKDYFFNQDCVHGWSADIDKIGEGGIKCTVYPNPTFDKCTVSVSESFDNSIEVRDISGKRIVSDHFFGNNYYLNIFNFPKGIYYVSVKNQSSFKCIKLIKL